MSQRLKIIIGLLFGLLRLVLIMSLLVVNRLRRVKTGPAVPLAPSSMKKDLFLRVSNEDLLKATKGFCSENLIGAGSFGSVYRGTLDQNETVVAVKVLHLHQAGALKSFMAECETLSNVRHRNLVKLLTACSSVDFQGNEFKGRISAPPLPKATVHRDLKPSNILLDNDMTAHVCDFGLAKFILEAMERSHLSSSAGLKGTVGYAAPEYAMGGMVSTYGDIYSFGILLLEMLTGKRPTDEMFKDGLDLHKFVNTALAERISDDLDPLFAAALEGEGDQEDITNEDICILVDIKKDKLQDSLTEILRIGVACSVESPRERMKLSDVIKELQLVRGHLLESEIE
ncbi:hypothetical protein PTKIN_Ptkin13bG0296000 [Pterospermum kingtungense]